jgi:hypothetical protein
MVRAVPGSTGRAVAGREPARRARAADAITVCGILGDKDVEAIVAALAPQVGRWIAVGLEGPRALAPAELARRIERASDVPYSGRGRRGGHGGRAVRSEAGRPCRRVRFLPDGRAALAWLGAAH